jgi:hypothetical protein
MLYVPKGKPMNESRHGGNIFWETVKQRQQSGNLYIVAFAAYGYKGAWDLSSASCTMDISPYAIPPRNTWGVEDVRFTKDEYEDYFLRFCRNHLGEIKDEENVTYLQEYVYNTTAGHPGLIAFFMNHIKEHFSQQLKYTNTLTFREIFLYLKSYGFMEEVNIASISISFCTRKKDCIVVLINLVISGLSWVFIYPHYDSGGTRSL